MWLKENELMKNVGCEKEHLPHLSLKKKKFVPLLAAKEEGEKKNYIMSTGIIYTVCTIVYTNLQKWRWDYISGLPAQISMTWMEPNQMIYPHKYRGSSEVNM